MASEAKDTLGSAFKLVYGQPRFEGTVLWRFQGLSLWSGAAKCKSASHYELKELAEEEVLGRSVGFVVQGQILCAYACGSCMYVRVSGGLSVRVCKTTEQTIPVPPTLHMPCTVGPE